MPAWVSPLLTWLIDLLIRLIWFTIGLFDDVPSPLPPSQLRTPPRPTNPPKPARPKASPPRQRPSTCRPAARAANFALVA